MYWICSCLGLFNWSFIFGLVVSVGVRTYTESSKYHEGGIKNNTKVKYLPLHVFLNFEVFCCACLGSSLSFYYLIIPVHSYFAILASCTYLYGA